MSNIFSAFEKAWESRHATRLATAYGLAGGAAQAVAVAPAAGSGPSQSARAELGAPVASLVAQVQTCRIRPMGGAPVLPFDGSDSCAAEQYKIIRTKILHHPSRPRCLVVSSAQKEDGKSITAVNIAGCLSLKDQTSVLLVDADMRRSNLASVLGVPSTPGLSEVLAGQCSIESAIVRLDPYNNLYFLPRGERHRSPAELLDSGRWRAIAGVLRKEFGFVVIDAPPVGLVTDFDLLQDVADGVVLVMRPDHTNRTVGNKVIESIHPDRLTGVVMNCAPEWFGTRPFGHDSYQYYDDRA
jgi:capsular exopolysaccharide synthesis family protein